MKPLAGIAVCTIAIPDRTKVGIDFFVLQHSLGKFETPVLKVIIRTDYVKIKVS